MVWSIMLCLSFYLEPPPHALLLLLLSPRLALLPPLLWLSLTCVNCLLCVCPATPGGYTTGRAEVVGLLRQKARPYLFSNTLAPCVAAASITVFDLLSSSHALRDKLQDNTDYFREHMAAAGFDIRPGNHPIVVSVLLGMWVLRLFHHDGCFALFMESTEFLAGECSRTHKPTCTHAHVMGWIVPSRCILGQRSTLNHPSSTQPPPSITNSHFHPPPHVDSSTSSHPSPLSSAAAHHAG